MKCPPSVTKGWPFVILNVSGPERPSSAAARPIASSVALQAETVDFDRQRKPPERLDELGFVGNDDHARRRRRDDLLAQQRAAAALDEAEARADLVGAVDREVEFRRLVERGQADAEFAAECCGALGGRNADDRQAGGDLFGEQPDEFLGGRAGADAEPHAVADMGKGCPRRLDLQCPCIHRNAASPPRLSRRS